MYNLLIAEDIEIIRNMLVNDIDWASAGMRVSGIAVNGLEALELVERNPPDILLSDIRMPMMDGFRLIMEVYERFPAVKSIILTAYSDFNYAQNAIKLGVIDFVLKPVDEEELFNAVKRAIGLIEKEREQQKQSEFARKIIKEKLPDVKNPVQVIDGKSNMKNIKLVEQVMEYIKSNVCADISLGSIAEAIYLNPNYLNRVFKQTTGESMYQFIIRCKMEKAAEFLKDPTAKVYEVCEKVGYQDQKHFSSIFTKHFGIHPSEYRNKVL